jgi:hypothetical protein
MKLALVAFALVCTLMGVVIWPLYPLDESEIAWKLAAIFSALGILFGALSLRPSQTQYRKLLWTTTFAAFAEFGYALCVRTFHH